MFYYRFVSVGMILAGMAIFLMSSPDHDLWLGQIEPQAGNEMRVQAKARFQEATLVQQGVDADGAIAGTDRRAAEARRRRDGVVNVVFPAGSVPPAITGCRGMNPATSRCVSQQAVSGQDTRLVFPPNPLGVPAHLETTWLRIDYF